MKTEIAKIVAQQHMSNHMIESPVRRPPQGHRFMVRFPANSQGKLIMGETPEQIMKDLTKMISRRKFGNS